MSPGGVGISPGVVEAVGVGFGAGDGEPSLGMSPAKAEEKRAHVRAIAMRNRFIGSPLIFGDARVLTSEIIEQLPKVLASSW